MIVCGEMIKLASLYAIRVSGSNNREISAFARDCFNEALSLSLGAKPGALINLRGGAERTRTACQARSLWNNSLIHPIRRGLLFWREGEPFRWRFLLG